MSPSIVPKDEMLRRILASLAERIPGLDPQSVMTSLAIVEFANRSLAAFEAHFARYGLSQGRFAVLIFLFHFPDESWTPARLAELAGVRRATMSGLLDVLERDRWIVRRKNPDDGRSREISLSASGRARLTKLLPDHFERVAKSMRGLSASEHRTLIELMRKAGAAAASLPNDK